MDHELYNILKTIIEQNNHIIRRQEELIEIMTETPDNNENEEEEETKTEQETKTKIRRKETTDD